MHVENRSRQDIDKLRELSAEHALLQSYQHERKQKTPPCAISWRPRTQRPENYCRSVTNHFRLDSDFERNFYQSSRYVRFLEDKSMPVDGPSYLVGRTDARVRTMFCQGTNYQCLWTGPKNQLLPYLFIGPLRGQNFVHGLHLLIAFFVITVRAFISKYSSRPVLQLRSTSSSSCASLTDSNNDNVLVKLMDLSSNSPIVRRWAQVRPGKIYGFTPTQP